VLPLRPTLLTRVFVVVHDALGVGVGVGVVSFWMVLHVCGVQVRSPSAL
jgi:hypothetical protein